MIDLSSFEYKNLENSVLILIENGETTREEIEFEVRSILNHYLTGQRLLKEELE